ncbi:MAG: TIGR02757 family protein [Bacteroidia bacterium]
MTDAQKELKALLDAKHDLYNRPDFIENDPISIPHRFSKKEDIEIAGFLAALMAWGKRSMIMKSASRLMEMMDNAPFEFVLGANETSLQKVDAFVHRTLNSLDMKALLQSLQTVYQKEGGLENIFSSAISSSEKTVWAGIVHAREKLGNQAHFPQRTYKHLSNPAENSAAKRINMFLRWMVRQDKRGVDFGLWQSISPAQLICPLDVHTGNVGRALGLLSRKYDDKKSADELTDNLRLFCAEDPVKYDFALFGLGVNGELL